MNWRPKKKIVRQLKSEKVMNKGIQVGAKGVCTVAENSSDELRRTMFNTRENCQNSLQGHLELMVVPSDYVVYKCKTCNSFHFGKPEWATKYGK